MQRLEELRPPIVITGSINTPRLTRRAATGATVVVAIGTFSYVAYSASSFGEAQKAKTQKQAKYESAPNMEFGFPLFSNQGFSIDLYPLPSSMEYQRDTTASEAELGIENLPYVEFKDEQKGGTGNPHLGFNISPFDMQKSSGIRFDSFIDHGNLKLVANVAREKNSIQTKKIPLSDGLQFADIRYDSKSAKTKPESVVLKITDINGNISLFELVDTKRKEGRFLLLKLLTKEKQAA